jgi:hypothetical protein
VFRRLARILVLLVAVFGLVPGIRDAAERAVVELATGSAPADTDPSCVDHGCTPCEDPGCACHGCVSRTSSTVTAPPATTDAAPDWLTLMLYAPPLPRRGAPDSINHGDAQIVARATAPPTPPPNA